MNVGERWRWTGIEERYEATLWRYSRASSFKGVTSDVQANQHQDKLLYVYTCKSDHNCESSETWGAMSKLCEVKGDYVRGLNGRSLYVIHDLWSVTSDVLEVVGPLINEKKIGNCWAQSPWNIMAKACPMLAQNSKPLDGLQRRVILL